jgi:hypothetical protein
VSVTVKRSGARTPLALWDELATRQLGAVVAAAIVERTFHRGQGDDDGALAPYSTRATSVSFDSDTGRRLKPKGGLPAYGRGHPRRLISAGGRAPKGWTVTGRHYPGGYAQYKRDSRRGLTNKLGASGAAVDLVLSGELARSIRVRTASRYAVIVGITGAALRYGPGTDARRPWLDISPQDARDIDAALPSIVQGAADRSVNRASR